ncbi:MAG: RNA methyltransferase [Burkholderiaceae bacterium]|nr:RNA methyltransferase [Burkholderiaceae bacterium]
MKSIQSAANPTFREWLKLATHPRQVRSQRMTLAEGAHVCEALLEAGWPLHAGIVRAGAGGGERDALLARLGAAGVPLFELAGALYDALGLVEHGIGLAVVLPVPAPATSALTGDALYLDGLRDPGNVGALLRVAAAAGVRHVLASGQTAALWAPKVMRAAQGAHLKLDLREQVDVAALGSSSLHWIGTELSAGASLWDARWPATAVGWVVGAEGQGATAEALAACSQRVRIPLACGVESLNVATAAAVCLFERSRRLHARSD